MKKIALATVLVGSACTVYFARIPYVFCAAGSARGLPFAITHPAHGRGFLEFPYLGNSYDGLVFDAAYLVADVIYWSIVAGVPLILPFALVSFYRRRKARHGEP